MSHWWNDESPVYVEIPADDRDWLNQLANALCWIEHVKTETVENLVIAELKERERNKKRSWLTRWMYETDTSYEAIQKWKLSYDSMGERFYAIDNYEKYHRYEEIKAIEAMISSSVSTPDRVFKVPLKLHRLITNWSVEWKKHESKN